MAFIQDPRLRQRWNQISHNAETVTENAAAGIWTFQHRYITPCLGGLADSIDSCTSVCLGDREERARRARERDRGARRTRAEYTFDFYDDWDDYADDEGAGGSGGAYGGGSGGGGLDWDRLLAGTGGGRGRHHPGTGAGDVVDQPRRKRGMSYGTGGAGLRKKVGTEEDDPTVIPRTAPLGFLARLPFKIGGTLRYKPSAANLKDHPGGATFQEGAHDRLGGGRRTARAGENEPLLGTSDEEEDGLHYQKHRNYGGGDRRRSPQSGNRPRSNTIESGETSSSYRSRGDIFPSDGEGEEDAVPLDDEFAVAFERVDDRASNKTRSSKGKRPADRGMSRTVSRTTISSVAHTPTATTPDSIKSGVFVAEEDDSLGASAMHNTPSLEDLQREEEQAEREELEELERRRRAASALAARRGLSKDGQDFARDAASAEATGAALAGDLPVPSLSEQHLHQFQESHGALSGRERGHDEYMKDTKPLPPSPRVENDTGARKTIEDSKGSRDESPFVPARLPNFG